MLVSNIFVSYVKMYSYRRLIFIDRTFPIKTHYCWVQEDK